MTSSVDALRLFSVQPHRFDLVITDYIMPHLTGIDLAKGIRRIRRDTPVILCTGNGEAFMKESAKELGIRAFLMKPYSTREIVDAIGNVLCVS
jgi:CheY-like chemotaxis protein